MSSLGERGITKQVLLAAPGGIAWGADVGKDIVLHYELRVRVPNASPGDTTDAATAQESDGVWHRVFSTEGRLPRSLRLDSAFAASDVGACLLSMKEHEAASFRFQLRPDLVTPALSPFFNADPETVAAAVAAAGADSCSDTALALTSSSSSSGDEKGVEDDASSPESAAAAAARADAKANRRAARARLEARLTPLDRSRAVAAAHRRDAWAARGSEERARARGEARARRRARRDKARGAAEAAKGMRRRGAASTDMLCPETFARKLCADDISGEEELPALGSLVDLRIVLVLATERKNIDEGGRLNKETLGFAPMQVAAPNSNCAVSVGVETGTEGTTAGACDLTYPPLSLFPPVHHHSGGDVRGSADGNASVEATAAAGKLSEGWGYVRPRPGQRVRVRLRLAAAGAGDIMGGALGKWEPVPDDGDASATCSDVPTVTVDTRTWAACDAIFTPLDSGNGDETHSPTAPEGDACAPVLLRWGGSLVRAVPSPHWPRLPVTAPSAAAPSAASTAAAICARARSLPPRVWLRDGWDRPLDPLTKGLPPGTVGLRGNGHENVGAEWIVDGAAPTWLPWAVEEAIAASATGEVIRAWAKAEPYGFGDSTGVGSSSDWGVVCPAGSAIVVEAQVLSAEDVPDHAAVEPGLVEPVLGSESSEPASDSAPAAAASSSLAPVPLSFVQHKLHLMRTLKDLSNAYYRRGPQLAERCERLWARALASLHIDTPLPSPSVAPPAPEDETRDPVAFAAALAAANADPAAIAARELKLVRVSCFSNMAASRARVGDRAGARAATEEALNIDPDHIKSRMRRAHDRVRAADLAGALDDAKHAQEALVRSRAEAARKGAGAASDEVAGKGVDALIAAIEARISAAAKKETAMFTKAFQRSHKEAVQAQNSRK